MNNNVKNGSKLISLPSIIIFSILAIGIICNTIAINNVDFAEYFNTNISTVFRALLAILTNWIPFSLSEILFLLLPFAVVLLIIYAIRKKCNTWRDVASYCIMLLSIASTFFSLYIFSFGIGYHAKTIDEHLNLEQKDVSAEDLCFVAEELIAQMESELSNLEFENGGFSVMPYSIKEMSKKLISAYDKITPQYDFIQSLNSNIKPVMLSELMSYTHITGIYTYFTGEANINIVFPDYTLPFTAAHEFAHQRGIAREDEANFVAFLVCSKSDDAYIRYSAYLNMYEYIASALYRADSELYFEISQKLPDAVKHELRAYSEFYDKYKDSTIGKVTGQINDTYLQIQGSRSYGMVVDLTVAYYKNLSLTTE